MIHVIDALAQTRYDGGNNGVSIESIPSARPATAAMSPQTLNQDRLAELEKRREAMSLRRDRLATLMVNALAGERASLEFEIQALHKDIRRVEIDIDDLNREMQAVAGDGGEEQPTAPAFFVPFIQNRDFVGREQDLADLHKALMGGDGVTVVAGDAAGNVYCLAYVEGGEGTDDAAKLTASSIDHEEKPTAGGAMRSLPPRHSP